jgi:hypothetical protein
VGAFRILYLFPKTKNCLCSYFPNLIGTTISKIKTFVMRKLSFILGISVLAACNSGTDTKVESMSAKDSASNNDIALPYTASYSSKFEMGDPNHTKTILDLYKDWDNNNLDNSRSKFADTITLYFSDGTMLHGSFDSVNAASKPFRNTLGTVNTTVHAVFPVKSTDKNENWVVAWFTEYRTDANGKKDSTTLQETWRLNKDGKADMLLQYEQKNPAPSKK